MDNRLKNNPLIQSISLPKILAQFFKVLTWIITISLIDENDYSIIVLKQVLNYSHLKILTRYVSANMYSNTLIMKL